MLRKLFLLILFFIVGLTKIKKITYCIFLWLICLNGFSQCFDCAKNIGGWTSEASMDLERTTDGLVYLVDSRILKYDFDCNLLWSKEAGGIANSVTSDNLGNIYVISFGSGLHFSKYSTSGILIWEKHLNGAGSKLGEIFFYQNQLVLVGTYYSTLFFEDNYSFQFPYSENGKAFIAKYDTDGNFIDAVPHIVPNNTFEYSEIDNEGNIYLTAIKYSGVTYTTILHKFDFSLQLIWSSILSHATASEPESLYVPTGIRFNNENSKIYLWGTISQNTTIVDNHFFVDNNNSIFQNVLTEINSTTGNLEQIKRFDTNSHYNYAPASAQAFGRSAYMAERDNELYILTNFSGTIIFPNGTAISEQWDNNNLNSHNLLLFKVKLDDFSTELVFQTYGQNSTYHVVEGPGAILFDDDDDLYITATFSSNPMEINGTFLNNNSGNNDTDAMLYKFNINSINSGEIIVDNTCVNELTNFHLNGSFDTISWDFGDTASPNNTSASATPQHQFTSTGSYHITAIVTCANGNQTIEKDIEITTSPTIGIINPIYECETVSGSGISSGFDTSAIDSTLINGQQNVSISYQDSNGTLLPSPLPNPYTNTSMGGNVITAKVYFSNNPYCYSETNIEFHTISKPLTPIVNGTPFFCIQENKTLADLTITGQDIKWYDAQTGGNVLPGTTLLQDGDTYYASQTINGCESERLAITPTIQNTFGPTGFAVQYFCDTQNLTLENFVLTGTDIIFYDSQFGGTILPMDTPLVDDMGYWASQTVNGCESSLRTPFISDIIGDLPANDYTMNVCDNLNDGKEKVDLSDYNENIIGGSNAYSFSYYTNFNGAENEIAASAITNFSDYELAVGMNTVYVRVENTTLCYKVVMLQLNVIATPILYMADTYGMCEGASKTITADAGFHTYTWSTGELSQSITVTEPGTYSVMVTEFHGDVICGTTKSVTVVASNKATITSIETTDWTSEENMLTVFVTGLGNYEYSIDGENYQASNQFTGLENGEYTVYVRDINGCGIAKDDVYLLMYPKFFSPNGDGYNDSWGIRFYQNEMNMIVKIFDRYGKFIKLLTDTDPVWDGTYNGQLSPATDYWFSVTREDGREHIGHFSLKR